MSTDGITRAQSLLEATGGAAHAECLLCGSRNPIGFRLDYRVRDDGSVHTTFPIRRLLAGYPGTLHGGVVSALLDSAMTNCLFARGIIAVTAELNVRFLSPVSLEEAVDVTATVTRDRGSLQCMEAELTQGGTLRARARAKFMPRARKGSAAVSRDKEQDHG